MMVDRRRDVKIRLVSGINVLWLAPFPLFICGKGP